MSPRRLHQRALLGAVILQAAACVNTPRIVGGTQEPEATQLPLAFRVIETRRGQTTGTAPASVFVDYEATVDFIPDRAALARLAALGAVRDQQTPEHRQAREQRIAKLAADLETIPSIEAAVDSITRYQEQAAAFWAKPRQGILQEDPAWQALNAAEGQILEELVAAVETYVSCGGGDFDTLYLPMVPNTAGGHRRFVAQEVVRFLDQANERLTTRLQELTAEVEAQSPLALLDMEAKLTRGTEEIAVSISPYRIVQGETRGAKSRRIGLPNAEDAARVQRSYDAHAKVAKAINGLRDLAHDRERLQAMVDQLVTSLRESAQRVRAGLLAHLQALADNPNAGIAPIVTAAKAVKTDLETLLADFDALSDASTLDPGTLATMVGRLRERLGSADLQLHLKSLATALDAAPGNLEASLQTAIQTTKELLAKERQTLAGTLTAPGPLGDLASALFAVQAAANTQAFGGLKPAEILVNPLALDQATAGSVNLDQTVAESGDRLEVTYRLLTNPSQPSGGGAATAHTSLDVRKFGYYTSFKSQILFYDRRGDGSSVFSAAPGVCYNLHYRPDSAQEFFDVVAPGIGLSVSAPTFENGTELAVGLQATFFNDRVQIGYAHNLSVDADPDMFYFGLDLIAVFQGLQ